MSFCKSSSKTQDRLFAVLLILGAVFLFWKAKYGYIFNDEPFILTLGHRLIKGDVLCLHEWNNAQLFSLFTAPVIKLHSLLKFTGIELVLFARYLYVLWWLFVSCVLYHRFRQYGLISLVVTLYFLLFTPLDVMSVTYTSVALSCICLFATYFLVKGNTFTDILSGVALSLGVIASPYCAVIYVIYAIAVILVNTTGLKKKPVAMLNIFNVKVFINITIGASIIGIAFLVFLSGIGIDNIIGFFERKSSFKSSASVSKTIVILKELIQRYPFQTVLGMLVVVISLFDKKRFQRKLLYFIIQTVLWGITMAFVMLRFSTSLNVIMMPLTVLGLQAYILTENKRKNEFICLWCIGIIFAAISNESSDTGIFAVSMATTVSGMGSLLSIYFLSMEFEEKPKKIKQLVAFGLVAIVCVQLGSQLVTRCMRTYWDKLMPMLDTKISVGVAKGVVTTKENAVRYEEIYDDLQIIKENSSPSDNVLIATLFPSAYLDLDMNYGTYSSWTYIRNRSNIEEFTKRLGKYYDICNEKIPRCVYVGEEDMENIHFLDDVINLDNYNSIQGKRGMIFIAK